MGEKNWSQNSVRIGGQQPRIIGERPSNAFLRTAKPTRLPSSDTVFISLVGKLLGGLWVGGTTYLTDDAITFRPNEVNAAIHEGDCSVTIPLREVTDVRQRFGFISRKIDVKTRSRTLTIRCFKASDFTRMIRGQVARQSNGRH